MAINIGAAPLMTASGFEAEEKRLARNRKLAEVMAAQVGGPKEQFAGKHYQHYVGGGIFDALGELGKGAIMAHQNRKFDAAEADLASRREKQAADWFDNYSKGITEGKKVEPMGPMPSGEAMPTEQRPLTPDEKVVLASPGIGVHPLGAVASQMAMTEASDLRKMELAETLADKKARAAAEAAANKTDYVFGEVTGPDGRPIKALIDKNKPGTYVPVGNAKPEEVPEKIRSAKWMVENIPGMDMGKALAAVYDTTQILATPEGVTSATKPYFSGVGGGTAANLVTKAAAGGGAPGPMIPQTGGVPLGNAVQRAATATAAVGGAPGVPGANTPPSVPKGADVPLWAQKKPSEDPSQLTGTAFGQKPGMPGNTKGLGDLEGQATVFGQKYADTKIPEMDAALKPVEKLFGGKGEVDGFGRLKSSVHPGLMTKQGRQNRVQFEDYKSQILTASAGLSQTAPELANVLKRLGVALGQGPDEIRTAMKAVREKMNERTARMRAGVPAPVLREYDIGMARERKAIDDAMAAETAQNSRYAKSQGGAAPSRIAPRVEASDASIEDVRDIYRKKQ